MCLFGWSGLGNKRLWERNSGRERVPLATAVVMVMVVRGEPSARAFHSGEHHCQPQRVQLSSPATHPQRCITMGFDRGGGGSFWGVWMDEVKTCHGIRSCRQESCRLCVCECVSDMCGWMVPCGNAVRAIVPVSFIFSSSCLPRE